MEIIMVTENKVGQTGNLMKDILLVIREVEQEFIFIQVELNMLELMQKEI